MRKFVYHQSIIYECEVTKVIPTPWECRGDEQLYIIESPEQFKGEKWYSQFLQDTVEQSYQLAKELLSVEIENSFRKKGNSITEWQLVERLKLETAKIKVVML